MNKVSTNCRVLELLVLIFLGKGLLLARLASAFVTNCPIIFLNSIVITTAAMSKATNSEDVERNGVRNSQQEETAVTVPLIDIGVFDGSSPSETSQALVCAFQDSGFAIIRCPLLTKDLQSKALEAASSFLEGSREAEGTPLVEAIQHPTDPKVYSMLDSEDQFDFVAPTIKEYVSVLRSIKMQVLRLIAMGLGMGDASFFAKLHDEDNDTLRLITYHPTHSEDTGNRCKEHSDYGTITLLSTDGVSGLELFRNGKWLPVPYVEGALVVNVGSLLSGWTGGSLRATLHRVAGPASENSYSDRQVLLKAVNRPRTSLAFFADPNKNVSKSLQATAAASNDSGPIESPGGMSVEDYISWRSGGDGAKRSGVSFTAKESEIIRKTS